MDVRGCASDGSGGTAVPCTPLLASVTRRRVAHGRRASRVGAVRPGTKRMSTTCRVDVDLVVSARDENRMLAAVASLD